MAAIEKAAVQLIKENFSKRHIGAIRNPNIKQHQNYSGNFWSSSYANNYDP
jgi:hypothetical protein